MEKFDHYYDYFDTLRKKVYSVAVVFIVFFVAGFLEAGHILHIVIGVFHLENATVVTTSPFQFLNVATTIGLYVGGLASLPLIIYHVYDFLKDGLTKKEKRLFFVLLPIGLALFLTGFAYSFSILYFYLNSISALNVAFGIKNIWDVSSFMSQIVIASVCLGLVFEFPVVMTFLIRAGFVSVDYLREKRMWAVAFIFIFVGFLPPPDIFSTVIQAVPLVAIYQLTLWANAGYSEARRREHIDAVVNQPTQMAPAGTTT